MEVYIEIIGIVLACLIILYAAVRAIDFGFTRLEDRRRFGMATDYTWFARRQVQYLSKDMITQINDAVANMAKNWMGED